MDVENITDGVGLKIVSFSNVLGGTLSFRIQSRVVAHLVQKDEGQGGLGTSMLVVNRVRIMGRVI